MTIPKGRSTWIAGLSACPEATNQPCFSWRDELHEREVYDKTFILGERGGEMYVTDGIAGAGELVPEIHVACARCTGICKW